MTHVEIEERIEASAEAVWDCLLGSRSAELAIGIYAESVEIDGEGVGSIRTSQLLGGAGTIRERIDQLDEAGFLCRYSVVDRGPLPFADYRGQIKLTPEGADACVVKLEADFTPAGMSEQDSVDLYLSNNHGAIAKIREFLGLPVVERSGMG